MSELEFIKQRLERLEELVEQLQSQIQKQPIKRNRLTTFEESPVYNLDVFQAILEKKGWKAQEIFDYYESAVLYSKSSGKKYNDWISAVETWRRKDLKQNNQIIKNNGKQTSAFEKRNQERIVVGSVADAILASRGQQ